MKFLYKFLLLTALVSTGCSTVPKEAYEQVEQNAIIMDNFIDLMIKGQTTRKQEQAMIYANRRSWHATNFAFNDVALPEDLQPGSSANLVECLKKDPKVKQLLVEALNPAGGK